MQKSMNGRVATAESHCASSALLPEWERVVGPDEVDTIATVVAPLLAEHPDSLIFAVGTEGGIVPMPESLGLAGQVLAPGRSGLDLVIPPHKAIVIAAWEAARKTGRASVQVSLASDPDHRANLHFFDVTMEHGIYLAVATPTANEDLAEIAREAPIRRARFSRVRKDELAVVLEIDEAFTQVLGWSPEEIVGRRTIDIVHEDDQALAIENWMDMLTRKGPGRRVRIRHKHKDGSWVWMEITNHNQLDDPEKPGVVAEMVDISEEMAAQEELRARERLLNTIAETLPIGLLQIDGNGRVVYTNDRFHTMLGTQRADGLEEQLSTVMEDDRRVLLEAFAGVLSNGIDTDIEIRWRPVGERDKELQYCALNLRALTDDSGNVTGAIVCVTDVTGTARAREELRAQATFDEVTRAHNRASTMAALEAMDAAGDGNGSPAVIFIDLDHFKDVNDVLGHAAGDEFLRVVAERMNRCVRAEDVVGRIGGDEFLVLCPYIGSADEAMKTANRIAETLAHEIRLRSNAVPSRASIGVAWSGMRRTCAETLVAQADAAMYESKHAGNGRPVLFDASLHKARDASGWSWPAPPDERA